jgi:tetratricopeptide (TPR) repeat protein
MKLIKALARYPGTRIFRVEHSEVDQANWEAEPIDSAVLLESEDFYIVKAKHILSNGAIQDCYMDISLPERINDYTYFFNGESLKVYYSYELDGDVICAVPIDCFGVYLLFYSKINPDIGIKILKEGLTISSRKAYIAEDLGYILRDEGRFREAAEIFQISVDEIPSSNYIYGELAACYAQIGKTEKAEKYQKMFDQYNRHYR